MRVKKEETVKMLLQYGANPNIKSQSGESPIELSKKVGMTGIFSTEETSDLTEGKLDEYILKPSSDPNLICSSSSKIPAKIGGVYNYYRQHFYSILLCLVPLFLLFLTPFPFPKTTSTLFSYFTTASRTPPNSYVS